MRDPLIASVLITNLTSGIFSNWELVASYDTFGQVHRKSLAESYDAVNCLMIWLPERSRLVDVLKLALPSTDVAQSSIDKLQLPIF